MEVLHTGENYRFHSGLQSAVLKLDKKTSLEMLSLKALELPCTTLILTHEQQDELTNYYTSVLLSNNANGK